MTNYSELIKKAKTIYTQLEDETSKQLFLHRFELNITAANNIMDLENNIICAKTLQNMWEHSSDFVKQAVTSSSHLPDERLEIACFDTVVLYGCGKMCKRIIKRVSDRAKKVVVCDAKFEEIKEIIVSESVCVPVISPEQAAEVYCNDVFLITPYYEKTKDEIRKFLLSKNIKKENIFFYTGACFDLEAQYFDQDIIKLQDDEIFIDGGAFNGKTAQIFAQKCNGRHKEIHCFEPDVLCIENVKDGIKDLKNTYLHKIGLWDKKETLKFKITGGGDSTLNCTNSDINDEFIQVNVDSIDNILDGKPATFIKMDIEGAELKALHGAKNTIQKYKPKLAICIYHKPEDIFEIPEYIKSLVPEYKLYIRHYSSSVFETVLYAVL